MATHIFSVNAPISTWLNKKQPPSLGVSASGMASTLNWKNPRLEPRHYTTPPADGVQEFDFVADPPTGMAPQVMTPIAGAGSLDPAPDWLRGVRVFAATNQVEQIWGPITETDALHAFEAEIEPESEADLLALIGEEVVLLEAMQETGFSVAPEGVKCHDITLLSVGGVPETKTEWKTKCIVRAFGRCQVKTDVPVVYRRTSKMVAYARVCHPALDAILDDVKDCLKQAVAAGVLAGVFTGNPAAVAPALKAYLIKCLQVKGAQAADEIDLSVGTRKQPGRWIPI